MSRRHSLRFRITAVFALLFALVFALLFAAGALLLMGLAYAIVVDSTGTP